MKIGFDLGPGGGEKRAEDAAFGERHDGVNAGKALGPGAAEEFAEDSFGLIVKGVGGGDGVDFAGGHELAKPGVPEAAGGFFDGLAGFGGLLVSFGLGVDTGGVKAEAQRGGETGTELLVGVRIGAAQAVMEVGQVQDDSQVRGAGSKSAGESDGVGAARKSDGQPKARLERGEVQRQGGG